MQRKRLFVMLVTAGIMIVVVSGIALAITQPAKAQCGSQASSCKNCHEVQGKDPVNSDGKPWHQSHAFGDFCYICHGGNQQATDENAAHAGMVDPLSDVKASCQQCHPNDLQARADVYAKILGVQVGTGGGTAATTAPAAGSTNETPVPPAASSQPSNTIGVPESDLAPNDPNLVDYVQRYNEKVLGQSPVNWGNIILIILIAAMLIGGGVLVMSRERLVRISFKEMKTVEGEFPADVVDMVPSIAKLKPNARKSLRHLLEKPDATAEVLTSIEKLAEEKPADQKE